MYVFMKEYGKISLNYPLPILILSTYDLRDKGLHHLSFIIQVTVYKISLHIAGGLVQF